MSRAQKRMCFFKQATCHDAQARNPLNQAIDRAPSAGFDASRQNGEHNPRGMMISTSDIPMRVKRDIARR